jgi:type VI secretion system protein ImpA
MPLSDKLLLPIPGPNPSGVNLYSTSLFDEIREARRQDDTGPSGVWEHEKKVADYDAVVRLTNDALANKTKDLFLASWLADALLNKQGFAGLTDGLNLMRGLLEQFWDTLYPELEDGDADFRASPLQWFGNYLDPSKGSSPALAVKMVPVAQDKLNWLQYSPPATDKSVEQTPKAFYVKLSAEIADAFKSLGALETLANEKFGKAAPSFRSLRSGLTDVATTVGIILRKKRELEPDPEPVPEPVAPEPDGGGTTVAMTPPELGEIRDRDDAVAHILAGVKFLRNKDPQNPAAYLITRGLRWGEFRAAGLKPDPKTMVPAPAELRIQIKSLALGSQWQELLEACERASGMACGRGWLDMQRYAILACEELGEGYQPLARALKSELRALLLDYPQLPEMFLMDDTPTANLETQKWLRSKVLNSERLLDPLTNGHRVSGEGIYERALEAANSGNAAEAVDMLNCEVAQSDSGRSRFIRKVELAQLLMTMGKDSVAYPILKELAQDLSDRKLEGWEAPSLVARPLALLYKCMGKLQVDTGQMADLHTRICKLDAAQALSCLE